MQIVAELCVSRCSGYIVGIEVFCAVKSSFTHSSEMTIFIISKNLGWQSPSVSAVIGMQYEKTQ